MDKKIIIGVIIILTVIVIAVYWYYAENEKYKQNDVYKCPNCKSLNNEKISCSKNIKNINGSKTGYLSYKFKCLDCSNNYTVNLDVVFGSSNMTDEDIYSAMNIFA